MNWQLIGDLFLCFSILGGMVLFAVVNANYKPEADKNDSEA